MRPSTRSTLDAVAVIEPIPDPQRWDWVLAGFLALVSVAFVVADDALPLWARVVPATLAVGFVPFRRQVPLIAVSVLSTVMAALVLIALSGPTIADIGSPAGVADLVLVYALCRWATPAHVGAGLSVSIASAALIEWAAGNLYFTDWMFLLPWLVVFAFALAMRYRARAIAMRYDQVRLAERNSLARELHDTVAHHVSAIAVQAHAGRYVVGSDPGAAGEALTSIAAIANDSIAEMRRMVGILRSDDHHELAVAPDALDVLAVHAGRPVVRVRGNARLDELPAGVGAALFRIAQESITNARRHSRDVSFVDVVVERHGDHVEMFVDNDGTPSTRHSGSGYGLVGMRERAEALGGTLESSAHATFGWRTSTCIPLGRIGR